LYPLLAKASGYESAALPREARVWRLYLSDGESVLRLAILAATAAEDYERENPDAFVQRAEDVTWGEIKRAGSFLGSAGPVSTHRP